MIQLVLSNTQYIRRLAHILLAAGREDILLVEQPDSELDGIIVAHEHDLAGFTTLPAPERLVLVARAGSCDLTHVWEAGIRRVVFEDTSLQSAQLAVVAAELEWRRSTGN